MRYEVYCIKVTVCCLLVRYQLASCIINVWPLRQTKWALTNHLSGCGIVVWKRSFIEPDLFDINVPFDIYRSDFSYQSALEIRVRIRVRLTVALFSHFSRRI